MTLTRALLAFRALLALLVCLLAVVTVAPVYMVTVWLAMHLAHTILALLDPKSQGFRLLMLWMCSLHRCWKCGAESPDVADLLRASR